MARQLPPHINDEPPRYLLRVKYEIRGRLAWLSHLETIRSMERIIRRAQLPYGITQGFNPHMKVAFGPALPVGAGGDGEYLDLHMRERVPADVALGKLQAASPRNLMCIGCEYVDLRSKALTVEFPVSRWEARFAAGTDPAATLQLLRSAFDDLCARGYIEVSKKKRGKVKTKRIVFEGRLLDGPRLSLSADGPHPCIAMEFATYQGSDGALRPDKFIQEALGGVGGAPAQLSLTRRELLREQDAV